MGEAKRRKALDPNYGKGSKIELKLTDRGYFPMMMPEHLKNEVTAEFSHLVPVLITRGRDAITGAVMFNYRLNTDGLGIDDATGEKHNKDFHMTTKLAAFGAADWLEKAMKPKANGLAEVSPLATGVAKESIQRILQSSID